MSNTQDIKCISGYAYPFDTHVAPSRDFMGSLFFFSLQFSSETFVTTSGILQLFFSCSVDRQSLNLSVLMAIPFYICLKILLFCYSFFKCSVPLTVVCLLVVFPFISFVVSTFEADFLFVNFAFFQSKQQVPRSKSF